MSVLSNQKFQLANRLLADLNSQAADFTHALSTDASGNPLITSKLSGTTKAMFNFIPRSLVGFNIVGELSSSVGEGNAGLEMWLAVDDGISLTQSVELSVIAKKMGCAAFKFAPVSGAPVAVTSFVAANVTLELGNDSRLGSVGY